tara:strand:- start:1087 stop:1377 length:291 start_codon:yes stop_codon:yes gene_type:complete
MKLTGKCKEDFEKWLYGFGRGIIRYSYKGFRELEPSMQYGVYVDFFDIYGSIIHSEKPTRSGEWEIFVSDKILIKETRTELRTATIEKANEIYNRN